MEISVSGTWDYHDAIVFDDEGDLWAAGWFHYYRIRSDDDWDSVVGVFERFCGCDR